MDAQHSSRNYSGNIVHGGKVQFGDSYHINQETEVSKQERLRSEALKALYWTDPEVDLGKANDRTRAGRAPGTCEWVLDNENFKTWQEANAPQLLLVTGEPGIGKTVLATFLVDHFKNQSTVTDSGFAYFFCMNAEARQSTGLGILRGLLLMLLRRWPVLCDHLVKSFAVKGECLFESIELLWPVFEAVITDDTLDTLLLLVDGLDECEETSRDLLVSRLGGLMMREDHRETLKLIITSRVIRTANDLASQFPGATQRITMDVGKVNKDLQRFIEYEVEDIAKRCSWDPDLKAEVTERVKSQDGGTFVWVSLALKSVSKKRPYQVIPELSQQPLGLQDLYARILREVPSDECDIVYRVLDLVIGADEPLTIDQLSIALHFYPGDTAKGRAPRKLPSRKEMDRGKHWVQTCAVLLRMDEESNGQILVNLIHLTLKEFLTGQQLPPHLSGYHISEGQARRTFMAISTAYLLSEELDAIAVDAEKLRSMSRYHFELPRYIHPDSLRNEWEMIKVWLGGSRVQKKRGETPFELCMAWSEVQDEHLLLLQSAFRQQKKSNKSAKIQHIRCLVFDSENYLDGCYLPADFLYVLCLMIEETSSAASGAIGILWGIMSQSSVRWDDHDLKDEILQASILKAARSGRSDILEMFVRLPPVGVFQPRKVLALVMGTLVPLEGPPAAHDEIAFELLFHLARLDRIRDRSSLLHLAAQNDEFYIVKRCIESGDQVSARDELDMTPLHILTQRARNERDDSEVEALICVLQILDADSERASLGIKNHGGEIPLHIAVSRGNLGWLQLLIDATTDPALYTAQDNNGQVPLHRAAASATFGSLGCSRSKVVAALLQADDQKKSLHIADKYGKLPMHYAAQEACLVCSKLLVEADTTRSILLVEDREGKTPLDCALEKHKKNQEDMEKEFGVYGKRRLEEKITASLEAIHYLREVTEEAEVFKGMGRWWLTRPQTIQTEPGVASSVENTQF